MDTASFRLPPEIVREVERLAARRGQPKSEIVREALQRYLAREAAPSRRTLVELADSLVTYPATGPADLATRSEEILREKFHARRRPR